MNRYKPIIYQALVRHFTLAKEAFTPDGDIATNGCGKFSDFTFAVLERIKSLGVTHIWFTGVIDHATQTDYSSLGKPAVSEEIVKGKAGSPYAIRDYYDVAPDLANVPAERMKEFEDLIERTHQSGLKVIIDFVPNHVSRAYKSIQKPESVNDFGVEDDPSVAFNRNNDFYYLPHTALELPLEANREQTFKEIPAKATGNDAFTHKPRRIDWFETVKLNYGINYQAGENAETSISPTPLWYKMEEILLCWCEKGVDGFRCDMAEMVPRSFWYWLIPRIKERYSHILFIAEVYATDKFPQFIEENGFDYLYDKAGLYDKLKPAIVENKRAEEAANYLKNTFANSQFLLRFMENHDEIRLASQQFLGDGMLGLASMILCATAHKGPLMMYAGQEFGESAELAEGFSGNDGKTSIFDYTHIPSLQNWLLGIKKDTIVLSDNEQAVYSQYSSLLQLVQSSDAFSDGALVDLNEQNTSNPDFPHAHVISYLRVGSRETFCVVVNLKKTLTHLFHLKIDERTLNTIDKNGNDFMGVPKFNERAKPWQLPKAKLISIGIQILLPPLSAFVYQIKRG